MKFVSRFNKDKDELLCELNRLEKEKDLAQGIQDNFIKEREALLKGDAFYIRYFISRIVFDCWKFDDKAKQVVSNVRKLLPYVLNGKESMTFSKYFIRETMIFGEGMNDLLPIVKAYYTKRQYRCVAQECDDKEASCPLPTDTLESVGDLMIIKFGKNSQLTM